MLDKALGPIVLTPGGFTLDLLKLVAKGGSRFTLDPNAIAGIERSANLVQEIVESEVPTYGINTGFGRLAQVSIPKDRLGELQRNIVLSHAAGVGSPLEPAVVRLVLALKVGSLARGYSGVRLELIEALLNLLNHDALPVIPEQGSVGASGDLAPLAHMATTLIGVGEIWLEGRRVPAMEALEQLGMTPIELVAKEGLALLNGTQVSTALALHNCFSIERIFRTAVVSGSLTVDAAKGSLKPFDPRIHEARGQTGQIDVAGAYRSLLDSSPINASHVNCGKVQDPYCLRCQPQVMGACLDQLRHAARILEIEANGVSDNPLLFIENGDVISGGNFHAEPVAFAADNLALVIAEIGALAERRIAMLVDTTISGLPPFLVSDSGLNSGFMIAQVTAAAVASENKSLAHPASVDSLPTSANQEDHVSMATFAARRLGQMAKNTSTILAIELLAAAQGIDFHAPLKPAPALIPAYEAVRTIAPFYEHDRYFAPEIEHIRSLEELGRFADVCPLKPLTEEVLR